MHSQTLSETSPILNKAAKAALSRWKLESLTGLLGIKALQDHQSETQKNMQAENQRIRKELWGYNEPAMSDDMHTQTILGDVNHPAPIVIAGQQSGSGVGKVLAGLAIGTLIPAAGVGGYLASQLLTPKAQPPAAQQPVETETVDLGLLRLEDLQGVEN
jgi:predicted phage tail protein